MAYKNLTFEQYANEVYRICKEKYAVVKAYPEDFEKEFADYKKSDMRDRYDKGYSPNDIAGAIALMV